MSEYWKSNAKKYCDVCKTWIADNKSSIAIHESGKAHKEKIALKLKEIRKRNDQKNAEENKVNKEMAAIERAALAAMDKDLSSNPCMRKQYGSVSKQVVSIPAETPKEKKPKKIEKPKGGKPADDSKKRKIEEEKPQPPELQSRIGSWTSIAPPKPVVIEEQVSFVGIDLGLPVSSGGTSKFESMSVEQLTNELDKADAEFKSKAHFQQAKLFTQPQHESSKLEAAEYQHVPEPVPARPQKPQPKWRSIEETGGFREVKEEPEYTEEMTSHNEQSTELIVEVKEEIPENIPPPPIIEKPIIEEKIVTLGSSNKKSKAVAFKKRKIDPSQQRFKERKLDD